MFFQVIIVRPNANGRGQWAERPYEMTDDYLTARRYAEDAWETRPDAIEVIALAAESSSQLYVEYTNFTAGRPYRYSDVSDDALRRYWEYKPLRDENDYDDYTAPKALWRWFMPQQVTRALIQLMGRVWSEQEGGGNDLGGALDGAKRYPEQLRAEHRFNFDPATPAFPPDEPFAVAPAPPAPAATASAAAPGARSPDTDPLSDASPAPVQPETGPYADADEMAGANLDNSLVEDEEEEMEEAYDTDEGQE